jgi:hypothetical protein
MTIAYIQYEGLGPRIATPEGPLDTTGKTGPLANFRVGEVVGGDAEGEFVFVLLTVSANTTVNQGDVYYWDNTFAATALATAASPRGGRVGTIWLGGRYGDPAASPFSYTFVAAGTYGVWMQRSGISLVKAAAGITTSGLGETTATAGQVSAPASATVGSKALVSITFPAVNATFTANTTSGSPTLTNISTVTGIYPNQTITGTGIPGSTTIASINGNPGNFTITMSNNASATGTTVTVTASGYVEGYLNWPYVDKTN